MKRCFFIILVLFSVLNANAQKTQDVLYLNNGSIIKGTVIEAIPNGNVKIQTMDGSIYVYKMDEVSKIAKDEAKQQTKFKDGKKGYVGFVEVSYGFSKNDRLFVTTTHGYQFNPYVFAGIGAGYDLGWGVIPVYLDGRFKLDMKYSPFLNIKVGTDLYDYTLYIAPTVGYRIALGKKTAINIGLSYEYTEVIEGALGLSASFEF